MSNSARQPAYPVSAKVERDFINSGWGSPGLTKRELIAAMAMQGLLAGGGEYPMSEVRRQLRLPDSVEYESAVHWPAFLASHSVTLADALLAELERRDD